jgi:penicillin-binding protein 1A
VRSPFLTGRKPPRQRRSSPLAPIGRFFAWIGAVLRGFDHALHALRPRGFLRAISELAGDGLTLSAAAATLAFALALPAIEATKVDWRDQGDYAVTFLDRNGNEIGRRGIRQLDNVPLADMPDYLIAAVLSTEDRRFYSHFGIDVWGTTRALIENLRANEVVQGGSSITQQVARILYLNNDRTIERKIQEAFIAIWLEATLTKDEILEVYLDRAYMGGGTFGVAAASEYYFDKPVTDVTLAEAAMLAGLFQAPSRYAPHVNLPSARARANEVLTNMVEAGYLTEGQVIGARRRPASVVVRQEQAVPDYFLDWAFQQVKEAVPTGDRILTVRTTLDPALERATEDAIEVSLRQSGEQYNVSQGAAVMLSPDGAVRAMVGGRDYGESQFNRATNALRQPGSSFKPFVYATAFMNGYTPESIVPDAPITIDGWSPHNFGGGYAGPVTLTTALVRSINTVAVRLGQAVGQDQVAATAHRMGITSDLAITRSLPLGSSGVRVIDMAGAYAVFANGGYRAEPYAFTQIVNSHGDVVYDRGRDAPAPEQVLPPDIVATMNNVLVQIPEWGTGRAAKLAGIPTAGKTGTTNDFRDGWFVGFTGNYVAAVWFGNDNYSATNHLTGGSLPARTWNRFMTVAHENIPIVPIPFVERDEYQALTEPIVAETEPEPEAPPPEPVLAPELEQALERLHEMLGGGGPVAAVPGADAIVRASAAP